jgi:integrase
MASILQVGNKWRAQVRRAGSKSIAQTFEKKADAERWARQVEHELHQQETNLQKHKSFIVGDMTLGFLVQEYRRMREELGRPISPTSNTRYMLDHLEEDLGQERVADLTPRRMVEWARTRKEQGAGGYTINMELSLLGTVIRHCASFLQVQLPDVVGQARPLLHYGQLINGGGRRDRRPNPEEMASLLDWLDLREPVVADAVRVAAVTGLRRGELARIQWADVDAKRRAVLVRQRKHPRRIEATDEWVPLLGESWDVVQRQESKGVDARVFPLSLEKLTDSVTLATRALGIPDLHLHDMRREANSALRDMGFDADGRKAILGHSSDQMNSRYVKVDLDELHHRYDAAQGTTPRLPRRRRASAHPTSATGTPREGGGS